MIDSITAVTKAIGKFCDDRDWNQFHLPRNICLAMSGEVGEV